MCVPTNENPTNLLVRTDLHPDNFNFVFLFVGFQTSRRLRRRRQNRRCCSPNAPRAPRDQWQQLNSTVSCIVQYTQRSLLPFRAGWPRAMAMPCHGSTCHAIFCDVVPSHFLAQCKFVNPFHVSLFLSISFVS